MAVEDFPKFQVSKIEFELPQPNYTVHTLAYLKEKYPDHKFSLIMGEDNLENFDKWKNYEVILESYSIHTYPRPGYTAPEKYVSHPNVCIADAPVIEISSTFIRDAIKNKKDIRFYLPEKVWKYIDEYNIYS